MADKPTAALDYLAQPDKHPPLPVCAVFGDETFLRRQAILCLRSAVLGDDDGDFSLTAFEGRGTPFRDVHEELSTVAMFGGGRRLVVVEQADDFVSRWRAELEDYIAKPSRSGVLALDLHSLPGNTRLYKMIAADGLLIDCRAPAPARLTKWLADWAKRRHGVHLNPTAADVLAEIVGPELGLLDQELAKLALLAGDDRKITPEMVQRNVGGWRAKTTWEMLDAAMDGNVAEAMLQLDRLLSSGEQPIGLLGQISASLRRFAAATRLVLQAEAEAKKVSGTFCAKHPSGRSGKRFLTPFSLRGALEQAGVRSFVLQKAERQLRLLGRHRGEQLYRWLLQADLDLKGKSTMPPRLVLERLIVRLSAPQSKTR
ncbi:MAG: DNA polymerase III subunit delta [Planctomycetes bacterium]|nr:DNA polymerase III subunit delta [Planctomycetota bacterium]